MGKFKNFLIQALDNGEDPFYNLQKIKEGVKLDKSTKKQKEKKSGSERSFDKSFVQNKEDKR